MLKLPTITILSFIAKGSVGEGKDGSGSKKAFGMAVNFMEDVS